MSSVDKKILKIEDNLKSKLLAVEAEKNSSADSIVNNVTLNKQEEYLTNLILLISLRSDKESKETLNEKLFQPCWKVFQHRCDLLACELNKTKNKINQAFLKQDDNLNLPDIICQLLKTTAVSILELKKLLEQVSSQKIHNSMTLKDSYSKSAKAQLSELARITVELCRFYIFKIEPDFKDPKQFQFFSKIFIENSNADPNYIDQEGNFIWNIPEHINIDSKNLTQILRTMRKYPKIEEYKDLNFDIRAKALHGHLHDCKKQIYTIQSYCHEINEMYNFDIFNLNEVVNKHSGTRMIDKIEIQLQQRMIVCADILVTNAGEEALFVRVKTAENFQTALDQLFQIIVEKTSSEEISQATDENLQEINSPNKTSQHGGLSLSTGISGQSTATAQVSDFDQDIYNEMTEEQKVLVSISNLEKLNTKISILVDIFRSKKFPGADQVQINARNNIKAIMAEQIGSYIESAIGPLLTAIEPRIFGASFDFEYEEDEYYDELYDEIFPRPWVNLLLLDFMKINSEVALYCPINNKDVIDDCLFKIYEELLRIVKSLPNKKVSHRSSIQILFDVVAIQSACAKFKSTSKTDRALKDIFNSLKDKVICDKNILNEMRENVENFVKEAWIDSEAQFLLNQAF